MFHNGAEKMVKHKKRWLITLVLVVLTLLVGNPLLQRCYRFHQVSVQLKTIQSAGEPTTFADILELYERPPRDATKL